MACDLTKLLASAADLPASQVVRDALCVEEEQRQLEHRQREWSLGMPASVAPHTLDHLELMQRSSATRSPLDYLLPQTGREFVASMGLDPADPLGGCRILPRVVRPPQPIIHLTINVYDLPPAA